MVEVVSEVDEAPKEILATVVSTNNVSDSEVLLQILDAILEEIEQMSADGAYDIGEKKMV